MAEHAEHNEHETSHDAHGGAHAPANPLSPDELFNHVSDSPHFHLPRAIAPAGSHGHIELPQPFKGKVNLQLHTSSSLINKTILPLDLKITKFMVIELIVAVPGRPFWFSFIARLAYSTSPAEGAI
jgi:hypothetical protein